MNNRHVQKWSIQNSQKMENLLSLSVKKWTNKLCYSLTMECYTAMKMKKLHLHTTTYKVEQNKLDEKSTCSMILLKLSSKTDKVIWCYIEVSEACVRKGVSEMLVTFSFLN